MIIDPKDHAVETMAYIDTHPELHRQTMWRCGTIACYAGHFTLTSGEVELTHPLDDNSIMVREVATGRTYTLAEWAQLRMEISSEEAWALFDAGNTRDMLRAGVKAYINGESIATALRVARRARLVDAIHEDNQRQIHAPGFRPLRRTHEAVEDFA